MNNNLHNILSSSECLSIQQLQLYAEEKLSEKDVFHIEKHLIECEMCQDTLDGILAMQKKKDLPIYVNQINKGIKQKIDKTKKIKQKRIVWQVAAAVLFLFVSSALVRFYVNIESETYLSANKKIELEEIPNLISQDSNENDLPSEEVTEETIDLANKTESIFDNTEKLDNPDNEINIDLQTENEEDFFEIEPIIAENAEKPALVNDLLLDENQGVTLTERKSKRTLAPVESEINMDTVSINTEYNLYTKAIADFDKKHYVMAFEIFEVLKIEDSNNDNYLYYTGMSAFYLQKFDIAIESFTTLNPQIFPEKQDEITWMLALSYLYSGNKNKALVKLNELASTENDFKQKAIAKLNEFQK